MPQIFGLEHILYLVISLLLSFTSIFLVRKYGKKNEKVADIAIKVSGILLLVAVTWNRLACNEYSLNIFKLLPTSFCGTSSTVFAFTLIFAKKDAKIFNFIVYCAFLGGTLTLIYPDFIGQDASFFYDRTISGLLHHSLMFHGVWLVALTGYFKPDLKKWYYLPLGLCIYITYGLFSIKIIGNSDAMQINHPLLPDSIFNWFYTGLIFLALYAAFLLIYDYIVKKKKV